MAETVSVIIPSFNRRHCLPRALDSVLAQTVPALEIIVVDDGSSDGTRSLIASDYPQVTYLWQPNRGVSAARNAGIEAARGDWLAFLDSDDEWLPSKLELQLALASSMPQCPLVHSDEIWIRSGVRVNAMRKHEKAGGYIFERCLPLCAISPSAALIRATLFDELGGFDTALAACEDYELWLRICSRYPVAYVDQPLLRKYGGHDDQLSRQHWGMDRFRVRAMSKLLDAADLTQQQRQVTRNMLAEKIAILAIGARKRGNRILLQELRALRRQHCLTDLALDDLEQAS
ncbi:MAG: glycosyltransferase [Pseudohongiellaceae bacterium]